MPSKEDLQPHIYLPLPNLKDLPKNQSKDQRLKTIIKNLETNHDTVRQRLITHATHSTSPETDVQMSGTSSSETQYQARANDLLLQSLSAPYTESLGDPAINPETTLPAPPQDLRQATPPPEIARAKEVFEQIELYDKHAVPVREYYKKALRRMNSSSSGAPQRSFSGASAGPGPANASPLDPRLFGRGGG